MLSSKRIGEGRRDRVRHGAVAAVVGPELAPRPPVGVHRHRLCQQQAFDRPRLARQNENGRRRPQQQALQQKAAHRHAQQQRPTVPGAPAMLRANGPVEVDTDIDIGIEVGVDLRTGQGDREE